MVGRLFGIEMDIYLDQNHWIALARSFHCRDSNPKRRRVRQLAGEAAMSGAARFPISRLHILEAVKAADDAQRSRLIEAFIHFGRGWVVRPVESLHAEELNAWFRGEVPRGHAAVTRGLLAAFSSHTAAGDRLGVPAREVEELDRLCDSPVAWQQALTSPGFRAYADHVHAKANDYAAQVDLVRDDWSKLPGARRRRIFAEGLTQDTVRLLRSASPELQPAVDRLAAVPPEEQIQMISGIPTLDVLFTLSERKTRDRSRPTDPNDLWDLGFLSAVIPYCQVVVTEKYWTHIATATKLNQKYDCQILARIEDLIPILEEALDGHKPEHRDRSSGGEDGSS